MEMRAHRTEGMRTPQSGKVMRGEVARSQELDVTIGWEVSAPQGSHLRMWAAPKRSLPYGHHPRLSRAGAVGGCVDHQGRIQGGLELKE